MGTRTVGFFRILENFYYFLCFGQRHGGGNGHGHSLYPALRKDKEKGPAMTRRALSGGRCRVRTCDPCRVKAVLYH